MLCLLADATREWVGAVTFHAIWPRYSRQQRIHVALTAYAQEVEAKGRDCMSTKCHVSCIEGVPEFEVRHHLIICMLSCPLVAQGLGFDTDWFDGKYVATAPSLLLLGCVWEPHPVESTI